MAALGFRGRVTTVGIDLGTTFSVVGANMNGKVVIIEDKLGNRIFPSIVSYQDNGQILAGYDALPELSTSPQNTIFNSKRFIGRSLEEPDVQQYSASHPFNVVKTNISEFGKVGFQLSSSGHPEIIAPEQVGTQVLKFLLRITADFMGHKQVNKAVIAVPAKFNSAQRQATGAAYKAAGLKVIRVIEEPTAAAVAYRLHKKKNVHHILVYDFGGGTLDVSLLYVSKGSVQVYATDGDDTLGGSDLDFCLYEMIKSRTEDITQSPMLTLEAFHAQTGGAKSDSDLEGLCLTASVRSAAEKVKKQLSSQDSVQFACDMPPQGGALAGQLQTVKFAVSKGEFETGCAGLFQRAMLPVSRLLSDLEMEKSEVDEIVLVGGSTRVPRIKSALREYFGKDVNDHIDPDVTVAYGAASILD